MLATRPAPGVIDTVAASASLQDEIRLLYDRKSAAKQLSISIRSLDYLIAGQQLKTVRLGKKVNIHRNELVRFASSNHFGTVVCP